MFVFFMLIVLVGGALYLFTSIDKPGDKSFGAVEIKNKSYKLHPLGQSNSGKVLGETELSKNELNFKYRKRQESLLLIKKQKEMKIKMADMKSESVYKINRKDK